MNKKINILEEIGNKNPFKVPEGYFEGLSDRIMSQLPERVNESPQKPSLWVRVQPWLYMAAMFCGIALMINLVNRSPRQQAIQELNLVSSADIEDFYQYYEEQLMRSMYNDAIYIDEE
jgi:hypothetical protein